MGMSRYYLDQKNNDHEVVVGWDDGLASFFVQVVDLSDDEKILLWEGVTTPLADIAQIARLVAPYADFPADIEEKLRQDQANAS
jgi:hypothetical protein